MATVLVFLAEGFEEIEVTTPTDLLRRAGIDVVLASLGDSIHVTGRVGVTMHATTTLSEVEGRTFDCLFLPGGPGVKLLRADRRIGPIVERHVAAGAWLAAICAAPLVLHDLGILSGRRFTAHTSTADELPQARRDERTVVDGKLLTSRGAGTALDFGLLLVEKLASPAKAAEISQSICA